MEIDNDPAAAAPRPLPPAAYPPATYPPATYPPPGPSAKSPMLAAFFSVLMPGLGHVYVGLYQRAMLFFVIWIGVFGATINADGTEVGMLVPVVIFLWLFNVFDAYRQATFAVWGEPEEIKALAAQRGKGGLSLGIAVFAIGLYGLLRNYFEIDLTFLLDHWYLIVMVAGGWLIWQAIAAAKQTAD